MLGNVYFRRALRLLPWATLLLTGCQSLPPAVPANVIVSWAHHGNGTVLAFGHDNLLASGGSEGDIHLWHLPDGTQAEVWQAHTDPVQGVAFLEHDRALLSAGYDGRLAIWERDGHLRRELLTPSPITALAVHEPSGLVITGHDDGHVRIWRLADFTLLTDVVRHKRAVRAVAYHPASRTMASSGTDRQVHVWRGSEPPRTLARAPSDARDLIFTHDGHHVLGGGWFKLFRWDLANGALTVLPTPHGGIISSLDLSPDGKMLATISRQTDSAVYLLDPASGEPRKRLQPHELCGNAVRLSPDGRYLSTTSDDGSVRIWDLREAP